MNALNVSTKFGVATILICVVLPSKGQTEEPSIAESFPLDLGLGVEIRYDDNIFRSATGVESSWITIISPSLSVSARPSKHRYAIQYNGDIAWYSDSSPDNYDDHYLEAGAYLDFSQRSKLDIIGSYDDSHENRGTGLTEGFVPAINIPPDPDKYNLAQFLGRFSFGSNASKGRLVLDSGYRDIEYTNHRDRTRFFDRDDTYADATFYYRVMPNTSLLLNARLTGIDYQHDRPSQPSLDNTEFRLLFGGTWDTSAKTTGTAKVGYFQINFDDSTLGDFSDPSWEVDIRWSPRTHSHFDFRTARYSSATNAGGFFVDNTTYSVAWEHEWSDRIRSRIGSRYLEQDFRGSANNRQQELTQYNFSLSYQMRRWLSWQAGVEISSRDSNIDRLEFDGNVYSVSALVTL